MRSGNVHSADGWRGVLEPVVSRYRQGKMVRLYFRGDAAFANPNIYEFFEGRGMKYAIRLPATRREECVRMPRKMARSAPLNHRSACPRCR